MKTKQCFVLIELLLCLEPKGLVDVFALERLTVKLKTKQRQVLTRC